VIKINRPAAAPAILAKGAPLVTAMHAKVAANPAVAGKNPPFTFNSKIYGEKTVKDALLVAQHDKCAYCEGLFKAFGWGDVEHYRPKAFSQQQKGGPRIRPGYYWLAYDWANLLASCSKCNQLRKKNLFPLKDPSKRATTPAAIAGETPMIVDPAGPGDPRKHVGFRKNVPTALTKEGEATIDAAALDREELNGLRLHHLRHIEWLTKIIAIGNATTRPDWKAEGLAAATELQEYKQAEAPFSAMTLSYLGL